MNFTLVLLLFYVLNLFLSIDLLFILIHRYLFTHLFLTHFLCNHSLLVNTIRLLSRLIDLNRCLLSDHEYCAARIVIILNLYPIVIHFFFIFIKIFVLTNLSKHVNSFSFEEIVSSKPNSSQKHKAQTTPNHYD